MPDPIIGGALISGGLGLFGASKSAKAAKNAAEAQSEAALTAAGLQLEGTQLGIAENTRQFDFIQELLSPYVEAGDVGVQEQLGVAGLGPEGSQQAIIDRILGGSEYKENVRLGEEAILQNASATGGLRGGNVQAALAQFRPSILNNLLNKQFTRATQIAGQGLGAATGTGNLGASAAALNSNLLQAGGTAQAQGVLGAGQAQSAGILGSAAAFNQGIGTLNKTIAGLSSGFGGGGGSASQNPIYGGWF